jgi:pyruvate kinase
MQKTKIICTIGPASDSIEGIKALIESGMNVARINFSHGTHEEHLDKINIIRQAAAELQKPVAILQDLCGPKIRIGEVAKPGIRLKPGQTLILSNAISMASENRVPVSYPHLPEEVAIGDRILLADGLMELVVKEIGRTDIICKIVTGGVLTSHKGINLPTGSLKVPSLMPKDHEDLLFGLKHQVDFIALSFVRTAQDIEIVKKVTSKNGHGVPVIAKIEKHEAVKNIDAILAVADSIMVARGDLGVEIPLEEVPRIQKMLVKKANLAGKPAIIATQMLKSMVDSPRPTRAEATDVANGVLDGADAMMLSEETAIGKHPALAVKYMANIAKAAEKEYPHERYLRDPHKKNVSESVAHAACDLAENIEAAAIVATTRSGSTAAHISRYRPITKIIALSPDITAVRKLCLYWGCLPCHVPLADDTDEMIEKAAESALKTGLVLKNEQVVITAGRPLWAKGTTNMLWVKTL